MNKFFNSLFNQSLFKTLKREEPKTDASLTRANITAYQEGLQLSDAKRYDEALLKFDIAIKADIFKDAYVERGICLQMLEFHPDAIDDFTKAISLFPTDANNYFLRSLSHIAIGEYSLAIADNLEAISLSKVNSDENRDRDIKARNLGYDSSADFYQIRLEALIQQANFSDKIKSHIIDPIKRRNS